MNRYSKALIKHLSKFITDKRWQLFQEVLNKRTRYITVLLEDIYQSQNASAVLRTCDCTGIQDVHIIEERNLYEINPDVALGSNQWLTLHYYNRSHDNMEAAVESLKRKGYRIVATSPRSEGTTPASFDLEKGKIVLLFGTELNGLTEYALELSDELIRIPMVGFTGSYNISVSAAIILYELRRRLEESAIDWGLSQAEREEVLLGWLRTSINKVDLIENDFKKNYHATF